MRYSTRHSFKRSKSSLKLRLSAILHFLSHFNHFPGSRKNRLISLFLPELYVELAVRIPPNDESGCPFGCWCHLCAHCGSVTRIALVARIWAASQLETGMAIKRRPVTLFLFSTTPSGKSGLFLNPFRVASIADSLALISDSTAVSSSSGPFAESNGVFATRRSSM